MKEKFEYLDSMSNLQEIEVSKSDFKLVQKDSKIHDVKMKGKPVTFLRDAFKRFIKNRSSVIGAVILGIIILSALVVPEIMPKFGCFDVSTTHLQSSDFVKSEKALPPKLFASGTGFYDGTIKKENIAFDQENNTPAGYEIRTVSNLVTYDSYSDIAGPYGKGGYINLTYSDLKNDNIADLYSYTYDFDFQKQYDISYRFVAPERTGYKEGKYRISLVTIAKGGEKTYYPLTGDDLDYTSFTSSTDVNKGFISGLFLKDEEGTKDIDVTSIMNKYGVTKLDNGRINIDVLCDRNGDKESILINSLNIKVNEEPGEDDVTLRSIESANKTMIQDEQINKEGSINKKYNERYWKTSTGSKNIIDVKYVTCDFSYDIYEECYGVKKMRLPSYKINEWISSNIIDYNPEGGATDDIEVLASRLVIKDESKNCIVKILKQEGKPVWNMDDYCYENFYLTCEISQWKFLGYPYMPRYLFGTDNYGRDYMKTVLTSLRLSLLLAFGCAFINIIFGIIWGSISGYFGGWTDIAMERFCDIVSGLPEIAIITLCLLHFKNDMLAFIISMFLTGWMGVASRTRTQFYRFKGREYVLASRTLGAKDSRLIFKHILPNSMGTIITSSILMIPSVIYSEASIAYLNLGLKDQLMFGVILTQNSNIFQGYTMYLLFIPTIIMALLLVAFNLFGNGLRDAFNPSLKGGE